MFDFELLQRVKLHSSLVFKETLDMTRFVKPGADASAAAAAVASNSAPATAASATASGAATAAAPAAGSDGAKASDSTNSSSAPAAAPAETPAAAAAVADKDAVLYDLFAVLMHSGSATGGHYYAYIKSSTDQVRCGWHFLIADGLCEFPRDSFVCSQSLVLPARAEMASV